MAKFCGKCGARLDEATGQCPRCSAGLNHSDNPIPPSKGDKASNRKKEKRRKKQEKLAAMTFGQKVKRFFLRMCLWLVLWIILGAAIVGGLVYFDIVDMPAVGSVVQGVETILHREHKWKDATCVDPRICEICDETKGEPLGHSWIPATCTEPKTCSVCKETEGSAAGHVWVDATCTEPKICSVCKETEGSAAGHVWMEATDKAPKTCQSCGATDGEPLKPDPIYLNNLDYSNKYGKVYYHDNENANYANNNDWNDLDTPGHVQGLVCDEYGNTFAYGIHMDGDQLGPYYITYNLDGKYTRFDGWCVMPDYKAGTDHAKTYRKNFEIYCDGKLVFTSNTMQDGSKPQYFEIDITDVDVLTVQYPPTRGPNDLAVLCDGRLS